MEDNPCCWMTWALALVQKDLPLELGEHRTILKYLTPTKHLAQNHPLPQLNLLDPLI